MVSYLDEKAMNVAQELSDRELYNYDALVGLLSARFDPASRVSASRSRFHGRTRRHQEDADTYADAITELCRLGYPQSSPELRQELISEQFVRGQSDPELKKYLWVVIRTQKEKKLQTLIEVCTDFASLSSSPSMHRPAEQVFALEEDDDQEEEMFAVVDRQQWNTQRAAEPPLSPELQQMFALARRMGYEMRPISRRFDAPRQTPGSRQTPNRDYRAPFKPRDYSRTKCFSCGQLGHTQVRCQNRTHLFRSDQVDGSTGRTDLDGIVEHHHRETKYRPGPNPHWPVCHQIGPRFIHTCHFISSSDTSFISTSGGISSSALPAGQSSLPLTRVADTQISTTGGDVAERTSLRNGGGSAVTESLPVEDTAEQFSVDEEEEVADDPLHYEDPVMHISGAGHWFLEGWIGDHSVEFLVDSGSSVTAISDVLYGNLLQAGAPVGALQTTARTLRSANGTGIEVLGCSRCSVSFLGLRTEFPIIICSLATELTRSSGQMCWDRCCHIRSTSRMDYYLHRVEHHYSCTGEIKLYRVVCSRWDIRRYHHIQRLSYIALSGPLVVARCRLVAYWRD